jgi:LysM repeat protein
LGCPKKKSRIRIPHRLPAVAAPAAVAGVAAAFCLSPQALAAAPPAHAGAHHAVVAETAREFGSTSAQLLSAIKQSAVVRHAVQHRSHSADQSSHYTVQPGDTLSAIAGRVYHNQGAWPVLYWANQSQIRWADVIQPGQVLRVPVEPSRIPSPPAALGPAPAQAPAPAPAPQAPAQVDTPSVSQQSATSQDSAPTASTDESSAPAASTDQSSASAVSTNQSSSTDESSAGTPGGSFGQCVVQAESGGNAQVMNGSGHYGLYQFSASTWAEYGGNPADFGDASVAEQNQVFANALANGGESNWSAYDGC